MLSHHKSETKKIVINMEIRLTSRITLTANGIYKNKRYLSTSKITH